jgi:hypothetical protein
LSLFVCYLTGWLVDVPSEDGETWMRMIRRMMRMRERRLAQLPTRMDRRYQIERPGGPPVLASLKTFLFL